MKLSAEKNNAQEKIAELPGKERGRKQEDMMVTVIGYDPVSYWVKEPKTVAELMGYKNPAGVTWINIAGLRDTEFLGQLAEAFCIHPLTLEDILNTEQRPKAEEFDEYIFHSIKVIKWDDEEGPVFEQISFILGSDNVLITFQERPNTLFEIVLKRIHNNSGRVRKMGADYLAYGIMDAVVDAYFTVLDAMGSSIEEFELRAVDESDRTFMADLQKTKQDLMKLRRVVLPLRENLSFIMRLEDSIMSDELDPFLKDLQDNVVQIMDTVENNRELLEGILDVNLSTISNRLNNIMKVLTIMSSIFIPLTFIAGVYGMNFRFMPELEVPVAYPITIGIMAAIAAAMILFFKRKKWF